MEPSAKNESSITRSYDRARGSVRATPLCVLPKTKPHPRISGGVLRYKCLTMTYFHRRPSTIIGAKAFHGPVRDGKAWDHLAMVVKRNWLHGGGARLLLGLGWQPCQLGVEAQRARQSFLRELGAAIVCVYWVVLGLRFVFSGTCSRYNLPGYRIKPHGQLVLVSSMHYCTSTPSLSTSWSRTTLQGALGPGIPNLQTSFPLRCLQRLSLPYLATRQCHWHDNRYTSGTSTPVLSY